ncbi:MAG: GNAT family N-acetyltransferase [Nitriliruptor sp.]|nr:MAG: GNAT family N-acetyltransferase [Nitriliruptor sp.]
MKVEKLVKSHDRSTFRCGRDELDEWFHTAAMQAQQRNRSARTTVLIDDGTVVGFYSLASHAVAFRAAPQQLVRGVPRYDAVPAVRLARLAIHEDHQGQGLGERLLATAVHDVLAAAEHVGIVLMTVDAIDEAAAAFYERYGFVRLASERARPALAARIKDLQATLDG